MTGAGESNVEREACPACGYEDDRDAFEGYETRGGVGAVFFVRCPKCEAPHPDQSDHDDRPGALSW